MPLQLTDEQRSMIASAMIAGGDCDHANDKYLCLCCGTDATALCALIVGDEYADALQRFVYEGLGCGFHHDDIRRRELGLEPIGDEREAEFLDRVWELDALYTEAELADDNSASDPSSGGGVAAAIGSFLLRSGTGQAWLKTGAGDTAWTKLYQQDVELSGAVASDFLVQFIEREPEA